jgi:methylated-DNA-[protein]-cysteine S-methyltransferase
MKGSFTRPREDGAVMPSSGSFFAASLGLHVEASFEGGRLQTLRITDAPAARGPPEGERERGVLARIARHLETGREDLRDVEVDLTGVPPFQRRILEMLREVPPGATLSYGDLAKRAGSPGASRAVGGAMARNPVPIVVPCHRVVPTGKSLGNYSATGGVATKRALLALEGSRF